MKLLKSPLTVVAAAFLFVALNCSGTAQNVKNQDMRPCAICDRDSLNISSPQTQQNLDATDIDDSDKIPPTPPQSFNVPDIDLSQLRTPSLRIGGEESPDVYLQSLDIQVEVTGNIASTRYTMVFKNKTNRILEGELTFPLPDGRSVTFYALDINGRMREAVPVEKARATQVFEEIQRREVDPGILERVEGNNFRTRIYPFPRYGTRTISIGYEEELTLENELLYYRLPMAYPDPLENFSVTATVWKSSLEPIVPQSEDEIRFDRAGENYVASFARENYQPSRALIFALPAPADIPQIMMQSAQGSFYFLASVAPNLEPREKQWSNEMAIIWDVSLSGSQRNLRREMEMLDIIFAEKRNANVHLYFLNNRFTKTGEYKIINGNWEELKNVLERAVFDGGTDFSKIDLSNITGDEILFFSDGISTLSEPDFLKNTNQNQSIRPIHSIVSSSKADYSVMRLIAGKTRGKFVNINALSSERLREELLNETPQFLGTEHSDALREVYPSIAMPVHGNFSIAGISDMNNTEVTLLFGFGNRVEKRINVRLDARDAGSLGNIYRIWAQKKIAELDLDYETNRDKLTELGQQFGIVTRNTSLIVLELISDYVRYGIEPPDTEPELLAEYQRRLKGREAQQRETEGNMLSEAVEAAINLARWWDTDFTPRRQKFPTPDGDRPTNTGRREIRGSSGTGDMLGALMSGSDDSELREEISRNHRARTERRREAPFAFESGEVIGYMDNPSPAFMVDMDDPSADPVTLTPPSLSSHGSGFGGGGATTDTVSGSTGIGFGTAHGSGFGGGGADGTITDNVSSTAGTITREEMDERIRRLEERRASVARQSSRGSESMMRSPSPPPPPPSSPPPSGRESSAERDATLDIRYAYDGTLRSHRRRSGSIEASEHSAARREEAQQPTITIQPIRRDNDYLRQLTGNIAEDYQLYLKLRDEYSSSPTFYFDMADWFFKHNDRETALRILTSIAELELENASLYRLLGYRFKEYGEYALAKFVTKKVIQWRPLEPQSYRDHALALADNGETQAALDSLYSLLTRPFPVSNIRRSRGIDEVAVTEINRLIAKDASLNTSQIDERLIINIPVDIRVVINWNMDNTDIDLHVIDPNGEECYYGNRRTRIGGRISADNTSGYGPEQFLLKRAVRGKYRVYVNHFSAREFTAAGPATVMAEIFTRYAGQNEQRRVVSLQLSNIETGRRRSGGKVQVAEFEF